MFEIATCKWHFSLGEIFFFFFKFVSRLSLASLFFTSSVSSLLFSSPLRGLPLSLFCLCSVLLSSFVLCSVLSLLLLLRCCRCVAVGAVGAAVLEVHSRMCLATCN